jgi:hypothetical protein
VKKAPPPSHPKHAWQLAQRMLHSGVALLPLLVFTLVIGVLLYHQLEGLTWSSSFLNASMLVGGMGPVDAIRSETGKWAIGAYAIFAGVVFLIVAGAMLAPVVHHALVRWHLDESESKGRSRG